MTVEHLSPTGTVASVTVPCLTILHHPELARVGERVLLGELLVGRIARVARKFPDFQPPDHSGRGRPLAHANLSRGPLQLAPLPEGGLRLERGECRSHIAADGRELAHTLDFSAAEVAIGVVLVLARRIVLLLHGIETNSESDVADRADEAGLAALVGQSPAMVRLRREIRDVADLDMPVLLRGETGTGKELVAAAIHRASQRRERGFVAVNVGALTPSLASAELFGAAKGAFTGAARAQEGYFRRAHQGTLFLDEIGDAPIDIQVALLRVLETGQVHPLGTQRAHPVDVRVVAATDADLDERVAAGHFRAPLLHRLARFEIWLPPLRQRRDDIGRLLLHFLRLELRRMGQEDRLQGTSDTPWLPAEVVAVLARHHWPGNVRELRNVATQLVVGNRRNPQIQLTAALRRRFLESDANAPAVSVSSPVDDTRAGHADTARRRPDDVGEDELQQALRAHRYELVATARALQLSRTSLYARIQASPTARTAADLSEDEIRACHARCDGDVETMVDQLRVSKGALRRRFKKLGLG